MDKKIFHLLLVLLSYLPAPFLQAAEERAVFNGNSTFGAGPGAESLVQVAIALVSVISIIAVLAFVLKKVNFLNGKNSALINVVGGISLSSKDRLLIIQVGEEQILISASPSGVRKIHQLSTPVVTGLAVTELGATIEEQPENNFSKLFNSIVSKQKK